MSKAKKADVEQQQFWQMVFDTHANTGLTIKQFCKNEGISEAAFYTWRKRLSQPKKPSEPKPKQSDFIEVKPIEQNGVPVELHFTSGHILKITNHADSQLLTTVIQALKQAKLC